MYTTYYSQIVYQIAACQQYFGQQIYFNKQNHYYKQPQQPHQTRRHSISQSSSRENIPISENNVAIGSIVFLPSQNSGCINCVQQGRKHVLENGGHNHPACILNMWDERPIGGEIMALCCLISSNPRPNPFEKLSRLPISKLPKYLAPTTNSTFRPEDIIFLEREGTMYKQSYVLTNHVLRIPFSNSRYSATHHWLTDCLDKATRI